MVADRHFPHSGIDVPAEATRIVRRFGPRAEQYMADWVATFQYNDPMAAVLRAVQAEAMQQVALIEALGCQSSTSSLGHQLVD